MFSKEINNSKRVEESIILKELIEKGNFNSSKLISYVAKYYGYYISNETINSCVKNINFEFIREKKGKQLVPAKDIYEINILTFKNGDFIFSEDFLLLLEQPEFKTYLLDSIEYSIL